MRVGGIVELDNGHMGTIMEIDELFRGVWRYTVQLEPVTNVQGQVFNRGRVTVYEGQVRELSSLEILAKSA